MREAALTLNAGSSSLKFALYAIGAGTAPHRLASGQIEGIGSAPHFLARDESGRVLEERRWDGQSEFETLLEFLLQWTDSHHEGARLAAVGHRIVHGGRDHAGPVRIDRALLAELKSLTPLAPLHQGHCLAPVEILMAMRPDLPQIGCFDTAFHHGMEELVTRFALPERYFAAGVRRYGFHGLSYDHVALGLAELDPELAQGRVIIAHLGNGASLCALRAGKSIDTSMGFTALDGLIMGSRCGAIDPGVLLYLMQHEGMDAAAIEDLLYRRSGLLGVSGRSNDMRDLLASDDPAARRAVALFVFQAARQAASLVASLGGLDGLIFTAGIGEHAPEIRAAICARLAWLGVTLDEAANRANCPVISTAESRIRVRVMPTDEEATIIRDTELALRL